MKGENYDKSQQKLLWTVFSNGVSWEGGITEMECSVLSCLCGVNALELTIINKGKEYSHCRRGK